jgi:hypothetical protein
MINSASKLDQILVAAGGLISPLFPEFKPNVNKLSPKKIVARAFLCGA